MILIEVIRSASWVFAVSMVLYETVGLIAE